MEYPEKLLPKSGHKKIPLGSITDKYFIRKCTLVECFDKSTGLLRNEVLEAEEKRLYTWSCNLYDDFDIPDFKFKITDKSFTENWDYRSEVKKPIENIHFEIDECYSTYFLKISEIKDLSFPFDKYDNKQRIINTQCKIKICHIPVNSNFWHFEIHWLENGNIIKKSSKLENGIFATLKANLREYCLSYDDIKFCY